MRYGPIRWPSVSLGMTGRAEESATHVPQPKCRHGRRQSVSVVHQDGLPTAPDGGGRWVLCKNCLKGAVASLAASGLSLPPSAESREQVARK